MGLLPPTLSDEFAHGVQVRANIQSRDGTVGRFEPVHRLRWRQDPAQHIMGLQPWVRQLLASQDLMFLLEIEPVGGVAQSTHCTLKSRQGQTLLRMDRPDDGLFQHEVEEVIRWADLRAERADEILVQIDHQWAQWGSVVPLRPDLKPRTVELLQAMIWLCVCVEMRFKQVMAVSRPQDWSPQVQPVITTPGHGSFPMGHATQAFAVAQTLKYIMRLPAGDLTGRQLDRLAQRIAINRIVAGVHFPVDMISGILLAHTLADFARAQSQKMPSVVPHRVFSESVYRQNDWNVMLAKPDGLQVFQQGEMLLVPRGEQTPVWGRLWNLALAEWES
ncbi:MAG: hypothetical protein RL657_2035 [Pseudomonadota bacterium]